MATQLKTADIVIVGLGWTAGRNRPLHRRAGTWWPARHQSRFHVPDHSRRAALCAAPRIDAKRFARDAHFPQQRKRDGVADAPARLVPAGRRRRRRRRALEWRDMALAAVGPRALEAHAFALRQGCHSEGHAVAGLGRLLSRTRTLLRQVRISLRGIREGRKLARSEDRRRQRVRGSAPARLSQSADVANPCRSIVRKGGEKSWLSPLSR